MRKLTNKDYDLYIELADEFYHSDAVLHPVDKQVLINTYNEIIRSDEYLECFIIEYDNKPAGYAMISKSFSPEVGGKIIWLEELYIGSEFRGHHLGSNFLEYLKQRDCARIRLEIEPDNLKAKKLYERYGFEVLPYQQLVCDK